MEEIFKPIKDKEDVNLMNPLVWAYVGDCVYELYLRTYLINTTKHKVHELHVEASKYAKASAQAETLRKIEDYLSEDEKNIVRRTRNTRKLSFTQKCNTSRLYVCYSFRRSNRVFIFM